MSKGKYFAAQESGETADSILAKISSWYNQLSSNNYLEKVRQSWSSYHGAYYNSELGGHEIVFGGEQGELANIPMNDLRNLGQIMLTLVTSTRPALQARSVNSDYKSLCQTELANGLLDYYMREKKMEIFLKRAVEYAIVMGSGYIKMEWDASGGELIEFNEVTKTPIYEGDVVFSNLSPFDVIFDTTKEDANSHDWIICRTYKNRFDLAEKFSELKEEILSVETKSDEIRRRINVSPFDETDDVSVYEFFHKRSPALPDGRYMMFIDNSTVLMDTPMPYRTLPVFRISPSDILGTSYGYTVLFDLLPIQDAINSSYSNVLTNHNAFAVQSILVPREANITLEQLSGGLNLIEYNTLQGGGKPEPINFTQTPPEVFKFIEMLEKKMEVISGISSVTRGQPDASLRSANALAMVQSQTLQFISGLQQSYVYLMENVGTSLITMLQDFAEAPRVAAIIGKSKRTFMKEFSGESLSSINRVVVDVGNPLSKCLAKDTPVLMFDGSTKMVQDIKIGELVMGPDSKSRTVQNINSGQEMMYEVRSSGESKKVIYGCNESHILSLSYCASDKRYGLNLYDKVDMSVKEYLQIPKDGRRLFKGYKTGLDFPKTEVSFPAYEFGLWLGDGFSSTLGIGSNDPEILDSWVNLSKSMGYNYYIKERENNFKVVYFSKTEDKNVKKFLTDLNLYKNKHIPDVYKFNDRQIRLDLLAGIIDTDGYCDKGTGYEIAQTNDVVANDIEFLIRSLGFGCSKRKKQTTHTYNDVKVFGETNVIRVYGNVWEIPCRVERKKIKQYVRKKNPLIYGIEVEPIGIGTYYGFTLKEEPHFLLGDFTVTHNTTSGKVQIAESLLQMGLIKSAEQYFTVLSTGELDVMTEGIEKELFCIRRENELILDGEEIFALATDDHPLHIKEHKAILSDPELRKDQTLVKATLDHIRDHIELNKNTDPILLAILGIQQFAPPAGQEMQPGVPSEQMSNPQAQSQAPEQRKMPNPPAPFQENPVTPEENLQKLI